MKYVLICIQFQNRNMNVACDILESNVFTEGILDSSFSINHKMI